MCIEKEVLFSLVPCHSFQHQQRLAKQKQTPNPNSSIQPLLYILHGHYALDHRGQPAEGEWWTAILVATWIHSISISATRPTRGLISPGFGLMPPLFDDCLFTTMWCSLEETLPLLLSCFVPSHIHSRPKPNGLFTRLIIISSQLGWHWIKTRRHEH